MEKSKILGVPLVLIIHAVVLTLLLGAVMFILLFRLVMPLLVSIDYRLQTLEARPAVVAQPTATPSASITPEPTVKKFLPTRVPTTPVVSPN